MEKYEKFGTKEKILDAALESFSTSGFDATSLDVVAKSLGVRKQTILYHFTTKKGLLNAVVERAAGNLINSIEEVLNSDLKGWERIEALIHSQNHVTYCFDNLIFNLASMSDYFGNYISLYLYGPKFQNVKWSGFVNKSLDVHRELEFGELVALENREWFTKIHSFRGDIIHKKVLKAQIDGFEFTHFNPQEVPKLDFKINSKLKQYFHIFRDNGDNDLFRCALKISNRTLQGMMNLMEGSEKIAFDKKHHWTSKL